MCKTYKSLKNNFRNFSARKKGDENQFVSVISQLKFPLGLLLQVKIQLRNKYAKYTLNLQRKKYTWLWFKAWEAQKRAKEKRGEKREERTYNLATWSHSGFFSKPFVLKILGKCSQKLTNLIQFTVEK